MFDPPELHSAVSAGAPTGDIGRLADVQVEVSVEIGRTRLSLGEAMALGPGAVVPLNRLAGQAVDLMVNGERVGKGQVVVVDDVYGMRVTEIVDAPPAAPSRPEPVADPGDALGQAA